MAKKTGLVGKALAGLKTAAAGGRAPAAPSGSSEKIVAVPEISVFSELPFARLGVIGGVGVNIVNSRSEIVPRTPPKKAASKKPSAAPKASKSAKKKSAVKKTVKRKKAR